MSEIQDAHFQLNIETHPDGVQELYTYGNTNINAPLLETFLALNNISYRKISYYLLTRELIDWKPLIPKLEIFLASIEAQYHVEFNCTVSEFESSNSYDHDMRFIFKEVGDWLEIRMPNCVEFDTYGSDHGMYEHDIILIADVFQQRLTERILSQLDIEYFKLRDEEQDGYKMHRKHNNFWIYETSGGFFKKFEQEVRELFTAFAEKQPSTFTKPKVTFEIVS